MDDFVVHDDIDDDDDRQESSDKLLQIVSKAAMMSIFTRAA